MAWTHLVQLLLDNLDQPAPNLTHLLLKFDVNQLVERTMLQPKRHFRQELLFSFIVPNSFLCVEHQIGLQQNSIFFLRLTHFFVLQLSTSDTGYVGHACKARSECWTAWTWFPGDLTTFGFLHNSLFCLSAIRGIGFNVISYFSIDLLSDYVLSTILYFSAFSFSCNRHKIYVRILNCLFRELPIKCCYNSAQWNNTSGGVSCLGCTCLRNDEVAIIFPDVWTLAFLQLMYELCVDPITCGPVVELLRGEKFEFFSKVCISWLDWKRCSTFPLFFLSESIIPQVYHCHCKWSSQVSGAILLCDVRIWVHTKAKAS